MGCQAVQGWWKSWLSLASSSLDIKDVKLNADPSRLSETDPSPDCIFCLQSARAVCSWALRCCCYLGP